MTNNVTAQSLYEHHKEKLSLDWITGELGAQREIRADHNDNSRISLVGHLNAIHPNQIQVLGQWELEYLAGLGKNSFHDVVKLLFENQPAMIIVADGLSIDHKILNKCKTSETPLLYSPVRSQKIVTRLQYYLDNVLAESSILHGVLMEVHGFGVLLIGASGIGKSELALELINRGHRLIADDAPEFYRTAPDTVRGSCPPLLRGFLEVRGLGILNVREMFGESAVKPSKNLRLIVRLKLMEDFEVNDIDRLQGSYQSYNILDVDIPEVIIPVAPGRNIAVLVEAAVRQHIQLISGYNAAEDFIQKQQQLMENEA